MKDLAKAAAAAVISAVAGGALTWSSQALTLGGRMDGVERTLQRIELRLDGLAVGRKEAQP